ncbi:putative conserved membrane protein [Actinokineospora spheciospongiae]|uniref:Putative conserved membrane protein n=1 Tax=Actinokineospora spheciospongiae TaxID=909613 RepID=W7J3G9_9PSEU|nr:type VII secretion protein EccB [Actinokineospora spheciospongiae]EWC63587.1 putative conserved membrane protein [Actinokineospora spheciospongiae]PWW64336.1 type VII secretion protein EccB [Actinokineospora spheciospongiae]
MPSTPTTKSQVQAYRFVLRRMQSALVRKDAVMLHDPMRTHSRATIVGVCIAAIICVGFLVVGLLNPTGKAPENTGIIIGKPSGAVYVKWKDPLKGDVLIPTFNLASARLLMLARSSSGQNQAPASNTDAGGGGQVVQPEVVPDDKLIGLPRERLTGIQDGPQFLPGSAAERISANWAVCDAYQNDPSLNRVANENKIETSVIGGVPDLGPELAETESLLVRDRAGKTYLVYRKPATANVPNADTVRAEVDTTSRSIKDVLSLETRNKGTERNITDGLLNAIPPVAPLTAPTIPGVGGRTADDLVVGAVLEVERAGRVLEYYVVLRDGVQQIKRSTADLIRFTTTAGGADIKQISPAELPAKSPNGVIDDSSFPAQVPEVLDPINSPVACLGWGLVGEGQDADQQTKVHVGKRLPIDRFNADGEPATIPITSPGSAQIRIDSFYMPPGKAAVVRGATNRMNFQTGPIYLISDRGVKYGVPDARSANALGLDNQLPAPVSIVQLLPDGASLSTTDVLQTYDTVPVEPGLFPSTAANPAGGG